MQQTTGSPVDIIEIPLSKTKLALSLAGSAIFVAAGIWFVGHPYQIHRAHLLISIVGFIAIVFFGIIALYIVNKLFDPNAGFIVDDDGLTDNSSMFAVGFVPWEDVTGFKVITISGQKMIMVMVSDADGYIRRQPNALARRTASLNFRMYGSPVAVSANALKYNFDELYRLLLKRQPKNKEGKV